MVLLLHVEGGDQQEGVWREEHGEAVEQGQGGCWIAHPLEGSCIWGDCVHGTCGEGKEKAQQCRVLLLLLWRVPLQWQQWPLCGDARGARVRQEVGEEQGFLLRQQIAGAEWRWAGSEGG